MIYAMWLGDREGNSDTYTGNRTKQDEGMASIKSQHDAAWKLFGYALKKEYGIELNDCTIARNKWGKPSLKEHPDICFSISHCDSIALCILSETEVGIDAEAVGRICKENVWRRVLSDEEYEALVNVDGEADKEFLKYWTLKESYGKAIGKGLSYNYKTVVFAIDGDIVTSNLPDYRLWQKIINKGNKETVVAVCRKQTENFEESIEWVEF